MGYIWVLDDLAWGGFYDWIKPEDVLTDNHWIGFRKNPHRNHTGLDRVNTVVSA